MNMMDLFEYRETFASESYNKLVVQLGRSPTTLEWSEYFDDVVSKEPKELWICGYNLDSDELTEKLGRIPSQKELTKYREAKNGNFR